VDSITLDFHKQFFQTISCGAFLLKEARHYELMRYQAAYLNSEFDEEHGVPNLVSKSLQTTRRFDALKLWMGLEALGQKQYAAIIDHGVTMAQNVADYVKRSRRWSWSCSRSWRACCSVPVRADGGRRCRYRPAQPAGWRCAAGFRPR
jgi:glutamate/tyrosine decarboxylase-like PLP-dependent enzyme